MSLIDETYFIGELNIPNTNDENVVEALQQFIDKYEKKFLTDLLGYELYKNFTLGLSAGSDPKWTKIRDGAEYTFNGKLCKWDGLIQDTTSPIANYVYYYWQRDNVSQTTGIGETASKSENSVRVSPSQKMVRAWNEMVEQCQTLVRFIENNLSVYTTWDRNNVYCYGSSGWKVKDIFYPINSMNL